MNQINYKIVAIIIIFVLIAASVSAILLTIDFSEKEEQPVKEEEEFVLDDRVSPYTNQGLFVEILRIRNRDLLNRMFKMGSSWKDTPRFYYKLEVDCNIECQLCDSKGHTGEDEVYEYWDTFGKESMTSFYIAEEQKTSEIKIIIVEEVDKGILGLRADDVEKESFSVRYDYRTGRWSGDDYFNDEDGYGYYLGEKYEIWFNIYQSDYDSDGIPYWTEVNVLGTDPTVNDRGLDPDGDGADTYWEWRWGYDPLVYDDHKHLDPDIDGIENIEEYQISKWLSNPFQPDVYIETDGMEKKGPIDLPHVYYKEAQQMIIERYAQHGIKVFIDDGWADGPVNGGGETHTYNVYFDDVEGKQLLEFYNHNFADERKGIFRYALAGTIAGFTAPVTFNKFDAMEIGNSLKDALTVRFAFTPRMIRYTFAAVAMHELGHSMGLVPVTFPGNDIMPRYVGDRYPGMSDEDYNGYLNNYHSIMNYKFIYERKFFDYSDGSNDPKYDHNDWKNLYLPTFQTNQPSYEEPADQTFEDFEYVNDYPGAIVRGYELDENLTNMYSKELENLALLKTTNDVDIQVFVETESENDEYRIKVYAKPLIDPVYSEYSLVAEGSLDSKENIEFYSQQGKIDFAKNYIQ